MHHFSPLDAEQRDMIDSKHALVVLANAIDWDTLEKALASDYATEGRKALAVRLMVGLHLLKHTFHESDESVCAR